MAHIFQATTYTTLRHPLAVSETARQTPSFSLASLLLSRRGSSATT
mgnify:CR=1 FL=1